MVNVSSPNLIVNEVVINEDDMKEEIILWESIVVCYMLGIKPSLRIINGFIRGVWGKYGIDRIDMGINDVLVVRLRSMVGKQKALDVGRNLYDRKPSLQENAKSTTTWQRRPPKQLLLLITATVSSHRNHKTTFNTTATA